MNESGRHSYEHLRDDARAAVQMTARRGVLPFEGLHRTGTVARFQRGRWEQMKRLSGA